MFLVSFGAPKLEKLIAAPNRNAFARCIRKADAKHVTYTCTTLLLKREFVALREELLENAALCYSRQSLQHPAFCLELHPY